MGTYNYGHLRMQKTWRGLLDNFNIIIIIIIFLVRRMPLKSIDKFDGRLVHKPLPCIPTTV